MRLTEHVVSLLEEKGWPCGTMVLTQDATMQRRMAATLAKVRPDIRVLPYAAYQVETVPAGEGFALADPPAGMWTAERYLSLLLGEIPRLRDDALGYGPRGKGYVAHVDIPPEVEAAFTLLAERYGGLVRKMNPPHGRKAE